MSFRAALDRNADDVDSPDIVLHAHTGSPALSHHRNHRLKKGQFRIFSNQRGIRPEFWTLYRNDPINAEAYESGDRIDGYIGMVFEVGVTE